MGPKVLVLLALGRAGPAKKGRSSKAKTSYFTVIFRWLFIIIRKGVIVMAYVPAFLARSLSEK